MQRSPYNVSVIASNTNVLHNVCSVYSKLIRSKHVKERGLRRLYAVYAKARFLHDRHSKNTFSQLNSRLATCLLRTVDYRKTQCYATLHVQLVRANAAALVRWKKVLAASAIIIRRSGVRIPESPPLILFYYKALDTLSMLSVIFIFAALSNRLCGSSETES